ncbi:MAG: hypothetical protein ACJA1C_001696 [Crocinitomicaceae bacterium]|jgi:hypothetical protein
MLRLLIFTMIVVLSSCTVTKRVHRPGWRVEWHSVKKAPKDHDAVETERDKTVKTEFKNDVLNETQIAASESELEEKTGAKESLLSARLDSTETIAPVHVSDDYQLSKKRNFSFNKRNDFLKELSFDKKTVSTTNKQANRRRRDGKGLLSLGLIIMSIGIFFFLSVMIAWANFSFIQFNSILGAILYILFALVGYVLILVFGLINAVIISLCIAAAGGILAIVGWVMNR